MELGGPSGPQSPQGPCVRWRRRGLDSAMCSWPPAPNAWGYRGHLSVTPARKSLRARSPLSWVATASRRCHLTPVTRPLLSSWWKTSGSRAGSGGASRGPHPPRRKMDSSRAGTPDRAFPWDGRGPAPSPTVGGRRPAQTPSVSAFSSSSQTAVLSTRNGNQEEPAGTLSIVETRSALESGSKGRHIGSHSRMAPRLVRRLPAAARPGGGRFRKVSPDRP